MYIGDVLRTRAFSPAAATGSQGIQSHGRLKLKRLSNTTFIDADNARCRGLYVA